MPHKKHEHEMHHKDHEEHHEKAKHHKKASHKKDHKVALKAKIASAKHK